MFEPQSSFYDLENVIGQQLGQYAQGIQILNVAVDLSGVDANSVAVSIKYLNPNKTIEEYLMNADLGTQPSAVYV